jgi:uncharacterized protein (DUF58 family)
VDWAVYARTRHLFVRRFERPTAVPVFIIVDTSASMRIETPPRFDTAARLAAAVASAAIAAHNPLRLLVADGQSPMLPRAFRGKGGLVRILADLATDRPGHGLGPAATIEAVLPLLAAQGNGVLVFISDFFEPRGINSVLDALRRTPQRLVLLRVTQPWDADPTLVGNAELEDCEGGTRLLVSGNPASLRQYHDAYREYFRALDDFARKRGILHAAFSASIDTLAQLQMMFPNGMITVA